MGFDLSDILAMLAGGGSGVDAYRTERRKDQRQALEDRRDAERLSLEQRRVAAQEENYKLDNARLRETAKSQADERLAKRISEL